MSSFCFLVAVARPQLDYSKRSFYFFLFDESFWNHTSNVWFADTTKARNTRCGLFTHCQYMTKNTLPLFSGNVFKYIID